MALIDTAKVVYDLAKKGVTIELQEKVMELREQALELQEENLTLKTRITALEDKARAKEKMIFRAPYYFKENDSVPFCQVCWEVKEKAIHMRFYKGEDLKDYHTCPSCHTTHNDLVARLS